MILPSGPRRTKTRAFSLMLSLGEQALASAAVIDLHEADHDLVAADLLHDLRGIAVLVGSRLPCGLDGQLPLAIGTDDFAVVGRIGQRGFFPAGRADPGHGLLGRRVPAAEVSRHDLTAYPSGQSPGKGMEGPHPADGPPFPVEPALGGAPVQDGLLGAEQGRGPAGWRGRDSRRRTS